MKNDHRLIVVGTSAGGVDALFTLVSMLPPDLAAPVVVVSHIGAHRSLLPELLATRSPLRCVFAQSDSVPTPGTIYVAPSDRHVLVENGVLRLFRGPKEQHARPAINPLFRSAALDLGGRVIGVILTGMLDDGAAGLYAIKACGGTTVVQDPLDAFAPSMPRAAIATGAVDHVVPLDAIGRLLAELSLRTGTDTVNAPEWLRAEHDISLGKGSIEKIASIAEPAGYTCPDCGGALFEFGTGKPLRFLCHTGHAYGLLSLLQAQDGAAEGVMWASVRALQEKVALLHRLADVQEMQTPGAGQSALAEADQLGKVLAQLRTALRSVPRVDVPEASTIAEEL